VAQENQEITVLRILSRRRLSLSMDRTTRNREKRLRIAFRIENKILITGRVRVAGIRISVNRMHPLFTSKPSAARTMDCEHGNSL